MIPRCGAGLAVALVAVLCLPVMGRAQAATATLEGTVVDESGAVVVDVRVAIVNLATALERVTTTDQAGRFVASLLPPGRYRLDAQGDGFATSRLDEVVLNVGDDVAVKVLLNVGGLDQTVTVTAKPSPISMSPTVATVVDQQFAANLPLNGRSFQSLIAMTPGIVFTSATSTSPGQFSVNGQRSDANYFMVDGVSANVGVQSGTALGVQGAGAAPGLSAQGGTNSLVSIDAMQEFKIETSTYAPEFGRMPAGRSPSSRVRVRMSSTDRCFCVV